MLQAGAVGTAAGLSLRIEVGEMADGRNAAVRRNGHGLLHVGAIRKSGLTDEKKQLFLEELATTCNVTRAARAAGMDITSFYNLKRRDPDFADAWAAALRDGYQRLEALLLSHAMGTAEPDAPPDGSDGAALGRFNPDLALAVIGAHRRSMAGGKRTSGARPRTASTRELIEALNAAMGKVDAQEEVSE